MLQKFLTANKVFLLGLAGALAVVLQQYLTQPIVDWKVIGYAALMATLSYIANQWRGQGVTITGILGTLAYTFVSVSGAGFNWNQFILASIAAALSAVAPPPKNLSYEKSPVIQAAKATVVILLLLTCNAASAQTQPKPFFKALPKLHHEYSLLMHDDGTMTTIPYDSATVGFRPIIQGVYGLSKDGSSLLTGAGASYEHDTFKQATQKWYTDWSVAALAYAGGALAPTTPADVLALGLSASFFNKLISVGGAYNLVTGKPMLTAGFSVSLNN